MLRPALSLIQLLVKALRPPLDQVGRNKASQAAEKDQTTTEAVVGLLGGREEVGAEPMADLTDTVGNSNQRGLLTARSRNKGGFPRQLQIETGVGSADQENEAEVAGANVEGGDEERAADCAEEDGADDVPVRFLEAT